MGRVPVSVVVPAFNEARRLPSSLPTLVSALRGYPGSEVIVVDDGSVDGTAEIAARLLGEPPAGQVIRLPWNSGKGAAIRVGVAAAAGEAIVFMDADLASDVADLPVLLAALADAEVVIGSRRIGNSVSRAYLRQAGSWAFNQLARSVATVDLMDTQCGFKAFRHAEAKILFSLSRATGFGFDVEVLAMAQAMGYRIAEIPVRWSEEPGSTFRIVRHTPSMIVDLARARRYLRRVGAGDGAHGVSGPAAAVLQGAAVLQSAAALQGAVGTQRTAGIPAGRRAADAPAGWAGTPDEPVADRDPIPPRRGEAEPEPACSRIPAAPDRQAKVEPTSSG